MKVLLVTFVFITTSLYASSHFEGRGIENSLIKNAVFPSSDSDYNSILISLLGKNYYMAGGLPKMSPEELGVSDRPFVDTVAVYGGPYHFTMKNQKMVALMSRKGGSGGYDTARCYIFFKSYYSVNETDSMTAIFETKCSIAERIKGSAKIPNIDGYRDPTEDERTLFNELSDNKWQMKHEVIYKSYDRSWPLTWSKSLEFSINYEKNEFYFYSPFSAPMSNGGGTKDPFALRMFKVKRIDDTTYEYLIWASKDYFMYQNANKFWIRAIHPDILKAKTYDEISNVSGLPHYVYPMLKDLYKKDDWAFMDYRYDTFELRGHYLTIRYDQKKPGEIVLVLHLVGPYFPSDYEMVYTL